MRPFFKSLFVTPLLMVSKAVAESNHICFLMRSLLHYGMLALLSILIIGSGALFFIFNHDWVDFSPLEHYAIGQPSIVLDDQGNEWCRFCYDKRQSLAYEQYPQHVIDAFIAAEDHAFFSHHGLSLRGILRSLIVNLYHGKIVQGASTITQQLVKLLYTDSRRTYYRKLKDQLLAVLVERAYSKEQIIQTYLNNVCFGCGIFGVQAASQRFWGKDASELDVQQAAALAGIVKHPTKYCPLLHPLSCKQRRDVVLAKMQRLGTISMEQYQGLRGQPLMLVIQHDRQLAPHLKETLRMQLEALVGKQKLYTGGLVIKTTLNTQLQTVAAAYFDEHVTHLRYTLDSTIDGALLTMDGVSGKIRAMVGGHDFSASKFNRALEARRQMASSFKPIVYACALQEGFDFAHTQIDEPFEYTMPHGAVWRPRNFSRTFLGQMTLAKALSHSNNVVSIKMFLAVGAERVIALARALHVTGQMLPYPSLALGCVDATVQEVVGTFNVFAHHGIYVTPYYLEWVKDAYGTKLYTHVPAPEHVLASSIADQVAKVLCIGIERARAQHPRDWFNCQAMGKTGTANDARTAWFVGATPTLTTAIYIGCDNNRELGDDVSGVTLAFPIWKKMQQAISHATKEFVFDTSLREVIIDAVTGVELSDMRSKNAITILKPS